MEKVKSNFTNELRIESANWRPINLTNNPYWQYFEKEEVIISVH